MLTIGMIVCHVYAECTAKLMTIMRIAITPLIAVLIWIDEPAYGYQLALALYTIAMSQTTLMGIWRGV